MKKMGTSLCKKKNFTIFASCLVRSKQLALVIINACVSQGLAVKNIQWILLAGSVVAFTWSFSWCQNLIKNLCLHSNKAAKFSGRVLTVSVDLNK